MSVLASAVIAQLNALFSNSSNARFDATTLLAAVNAAIDDAWPTVKNVSVDSSAALVSSTYEYTPTATPEVEWGFSQAYVTFGTEAKTLLRNITQRQSGTTWTVRVPMGLASDYSGETLHLLYNSRVPRVTAVGDSIELPMRYLERASALWLAENALIKTAQYDTDSFERLIPKWTADARLALGAARRGDLPQMIKPYTETGGGVWYADEIPAP